MRCWFICVDPPAQGRRARLVSRVVFRRAPDPQRGGGRFGGRADLLAAWAVLGALCFSCRARERDGYSGWAGLLLAVGLWAKEQAVVLPGMVFALDWYLHRTGRLARWPRAEYALYALVIGVWLVVRWQVLSGFAVPDISGLDNPLAAMHAPLRIVNAGVIAWRYLLLLVMPYRL